MPQRVATAEEPSTQGARGTVCSSTSRCAITPRSASAGPRISTAARSADQLVAALSTAEEIAMPSFLLGGGSNLLVSDDGFRGLVIRNAIEGVEFDNTAGAGGSRCRFPAVHLRVSRSAAFPASSSRPAFPASIGGALYGNAGCYGQDIGSFTIECTHCALDGSGIETRPASWYEFAYRDSRPEREPRVLISCLLQLAPRRSRRHPGRDRGEARDPARRSIRSGGSSRPQARTSRIFRRTGRCRGCALAGTRRVPAGQLLDQVGCRGLRVGDAHGVSQARQHHRQRRPRHAREVLELAEIMKSRVRERFGVTLEEEVMFLGERPVAEAPSR